MPYFPPKRPSLRHSLPARRERREEGVEKVKNL